MASWKFSPMICFITQVFLITAKIMVRIQVKFCSYKNIFYLFNEKTPKCTNENLKILYAHFCMHLANISSMALKLLQCNL